MTDARTRQGDPTAAFRRSPVLACCAVLVALGCGGERGAAVPSDTMPAPGAAADSIAAATVAPAEDSVPEPPTAVTAFLQYVETQRSPDSVAARDVAVQGLRLLATGIEELAARDTAVATRVGERLRTLRARSDSVQREPEALVRARIASESFVLAGDLLQTLQEGSPPALTDRAAEVRQAAVAVRSDQPLSTQEDAVRRFFERSAAALRGLIGARPDR